MRGGSSLAQEAWPAPPGYPLRSEPGEVARTPLARDWPVAGTVGQGDPTASGEADEWPPPGWFKNPPVPSPPGRRAEPTAAWPAWLNLGRVAWPWWLLWPWTVAWSAVWIMQAGVSWHFFAQGGRLLLGSGAGTGLQLYAAHPDLQIGPLALAVAALAELLGPPAGAVVALSAMSLTGPLVLAGVWRLLPAADQLRRFRLLGAGLVFLPVWSELTTHFGHLDDLLALCFSVAAMHAVARRNPVWAALAVAAAADAKPWAAAFVPLLLALPRRQWLTAAAVLAGGLAVVWLPFLLADPRTLALVHFTIPNDPSSALRALGITAPRTPWWDRSAQLVLGLAGGALAVWRGRWQAVPLIALSARILLDPGVYAYYTAGVLLGTVVVDLVVARWRVPWATITGATLLYAARSTHVLVPFTLHELGVLRLVFALGIPLAVLAVPGWSLARRRGRHARRLTDGSYSVLPPVPAAGQPTVPGPVLGTGPRVPPRDRTGPWGPSHDRPAPGSRPAPRPWVPVNNWSTSHPVMPLVPQHALHHGD
jgi:hypothetical protein